MLQKGVDLQLQGKNCCRYNISEPYEKLKAFTRGRSVSRESLEAFVAGIEVSVGC